MASSDPVPGSAAARDYAAAPLIWLRDKHTGRLERERFGLTAFSAVPSSPYYNPSPGSVYQVRAWLDQDGQHAVIAHDCTDHRDVHILPWPTWQVLPDGQVDPSYSCDDCGVHARVRIDYEEVPNG